MLNSKGYSKASEYQCIESSLMDLLIGLRESVDVDERESGTEDEMEEKEREREKEREKEREREEK